MVNTLHEQLLDEIKSMFEVVHRPPSVGVGRHLAALRAVVELHAPDARWDPPVCSKCVDPVDNDCYQVRPCSTVRAVASALGALGVETAEVSAEFRESTDRFITENDEVLRRLADQDRAGS